MTTTESIYTTSQIPTLDSLSYRWTEVGNYEVTSGVQVIGYLSEDAGPGTAKRHNAALQLIKDWTYMRNFYLRERKH